MINDNQLWAVEWDPLVKLTHIQALDETIEANLRYVTHGEGNSGWILVGVAKSREDAEKLADLMDERLC